MEQKQTHTIFFIGDRAKDIDFIKMQNAKDVLQRKNIPVKFISYQKVWELKSLPKVETDSIVFFLFFPFYYWNKHIEFKKSAGIYGNKDFYDRFVLFWESMTKKVKKAYPGKKIMAIHACDTAAET